MHTAAPLRAQTPQSILSDVETVQYITPEPAPHFSESSQNVFEYESTHELQTTELFESLSLNATTEEQRFRNGLMDLIEKLSRKVQSLNSRVTTLETNTARKSATSCVYEILRITAAAFRKAYSKFNPHESRKPTRKNLY